MIERSDVDTTTASTRIRKRCLQWVSGAFSGPPTVFDYKQLYRPLVLGSTTQQPSYPTRFLSTLSESLSCGAMEGKTRSFKDFTTVATHLSRFSTTTTATTQYYRNNIIILFYHQTHCNVFL